jgi:hypothetical protein
MARDYYFFFFVIKFFLRNVNFDLENITIFAFFFACKFFVTGYLDIVFYDLRLDQRNSQEENEK